MNEPLISERLSKVYGVTFTSVLDKWMRQVLVEFTMVSHGQTQHLDKTGKASERSTPPGELCPDAEVWAKRYEQAHAFEARRTVYRDAKQALEAFRKRPAPPPSVDPERAREDRICAETTGMRDVDVVQAHPVMTLYRVHRMRKQRGLDPLDGTGDQRTEVIRLREEGKSFRQIAMITGLHRNRVQRILVKHGG